jgi:hypothetical protein
MVETRKSRKLGGEALNFGRSASGEKVTDFGRPIPYRWRNAWAGSGLVSELVPAEQRRHGRRLAQGLAVRLTIVGLYVGTLSPIGRGEMMKAVIISAAVMALLSSPACAQQGWPARNDCEAIVRDLELRPPSYGDPSRVNYVWESYLANCEHLPWTKMI